MAEYMIHISNYYKFIDILLMNGYTVTLKKVNSTEIKIITTDENDKLMEQIKDDNF